MEAKHKRRIAGWLSVIAAIIGLFVVELTGDVDQPDAPQPSEPALIEKEDIPVPEAIGVAGAESEDAEPDTLLDLDSEAQEIVQNATETPERFDLAGGLRGVDKTPVAQLEGPLATPNFPGCETRILPTNWSNRTSTVKAIGLHYTAGANRKGKSDMNGLTAYASSSSAGVSWHFLIDEEGHCYYSVPLNKKAWTIGNLNSQTVNIEVIGTGRERTYPAGSRGARKLASVVNRLGRIYNIPMTVGAVRNCTVTKRGIITHWQGGRCAGSHHDIKPYNINSVVQNIARSQLAPGNVTTWCRKLNWYRVKERRGRTTKSQRSNARERKRNIHRRNYRCTSGGPVRA